MKAVLATLLCYLLFNAECFAHKGGPFEGGKNAVSTVGTYAAILVPAPEEEQNTLGLFTLVVPQVGLASGTAFMFGFGATLTGTVQGAVDPNSATLYAVITTEFDITVAQSDTTDLIVSFHANGQLNGNKIVAGKSFSSMPRITGSADITFSTSQIGQQFFPTFPNNDVITFTVLGFKQT